MGRRYAAAISFELDERVLTLSCNLQLTNSGLIRISGVGLRKGLGMFDFGKSSGGGRRTGKREAAPLCVVLTTFAKSYTGLVVDISATGARIRGEELPDVGRDLYLAIADLKTFGDVRWHIENECGVQFYEPLLQREVVDVRREVAKGAGLAPVFRAAMDDWVLGVAR